jgi:hypothetical protein
LRFGGTVTWTQPELVPPLVPPDEQLLCARSAHGPKANKMNEMK